MELTKEQEQAKKEEIHNMLEAIRNRNKAEVKKYQGKKSIISRAVYEYMTEMNAYIKKIQKIYK